MPAKTLLTLNDQGRVTIPAEARRALHLGPDAKLECEVVDNTIVLRPVVMVPAEDAWAYSSRVQESLRRAEEDVRAGRIYRISKEFLEAVLEEADAADREGRDLTREDALTMLERGVEEGLVEKVGEAEK